MGSRWLLGLALFLLLPGCAATMSGPPRARTGAIRGILRLPAPAGASAMASTRAGAHATARAETPRDAVIYVESMPTVPAKAEAHGKPGSKSKDTSLEKRAPERRPAAKRVVADAPRVSTAESDATPHAVIGQAEHRFLPRVLPVALGTKVFFENRDRVWHNAFSISPAKRFDLGKYPPRQTRAVTFDAPGVVQLYSDIDPSMAGFVFVSPSPIFTQPDAGGAFALPDLPAGTYTLKVWHPTLGRLTRRVEVTGQADAAVSLAF
jgi:plastocyanin